MIENNNETAVMVSEITVPATAIISRKHLVMLIGLIIAVVDQLTKWRIEAEIPLYTSVIPYPDWYPFFQLSHIANTGTAFGMFPQAKIIFMILATAVTIGLVYFNYQLSATSLKLRLALGFLFGGALGNLVDRYRIGHVTDFLNFNLRPFVAPLIDIPILDWPVFNVADIAISSGIALLLYIMWREPETIEEGVGSRDAAPY